MKENIVTYYYDCFKKLSEEHGFKVTMEHNDDRSFFIEHSSNNFKFKVVKYYIEFNTYVYKIDQDDGGIELFNLLEYLYREKPNSPQTNYYRKENIPENSLKKQLRHISDILYSNFDLVNEFFNDETYLHSANEFSKYWKNKHPEFYNQCSK